MTDRSLFAHRDFRLLLTGQTTSQLGSQVSAVAIPLLAVVTLHATPLQLGIVTASSTVAFAVIGLPAGAWLDRIRRRPVLVAADVSRALLLATIPAAALLGVLTIWQLVLVCLLVGVGRVFFDIGYRSYLPSVIGTDRVLAGNSTLEFVRASGQVAGPGLGGAAVSLIGAAAVVGVQSVTFAVSAVSLLAIRTREATVDPPEQRVSMHKQVAEGLTFVLRHRILRATAIASALGNLTFAIASAVNIIFLSRTLGLSPAAIGVIIAAGSVTVMIGAAFVTRLSRFVGSARIIWLSLAATTPLSIIGAFAQPGWLVSLIVVGIAAGEFGQIIYAITSLSLRQRICPDRLLGRVNATMQVLIMGLFPLGALLGGILGELIGARYTLLVAGAVGIPGIIVLYMVLRGTRDVENIAGVS